MSEASNAYPAPATFTGADGKTYHVRAITLNGLIALEQFYQAESIQDLFDAAKLHLEKLPNLRFLLWTVLKPSHPDLTEQKTGDIIDIFTLQDARDAVVAAFNRGLPQSRGQEAEPPADPQISPAGPEGS